MSGEASRILTIIPVSAMYFVLATGQEREGEGV